MQLAVRHNLQVFDLADHSLREDAAIVLPIREAQAVMGETVAAYLDRVAWRFDLPTICMVNGECYSRAEWAGRALALNDNVEFISRPLGGGSGSSTAKSIGSIVALIALTALAPYAAAALGGGALGTASALTFGGKLLSAAIIGAGALAVSHFLAPKSGGKTAATDALYSFGLQGNAARPMQPIPVLNGRLRFAPDYGAPTYSEYDGDTMIDYALYCLTCGRIRVEQLLIGDTPIWDYQTGPSPDYPGIEFQVVEPGQQVTLYPVNVVTADELSGAELTTTYTPGYIVNAAGTVAKQLLLDFVWPGGCYRTNSSGATIPAATHIVVRIRKVDVAGAPTEDWHEAFGNIYTYAKQTQIRVTVRIDVAPGRYEVSAKRFNPPQTDSGRGSDAVTWTALRAHIDGPQSFPRVTMLAVKGVASKQLSGVSGGQLRVIGTRILPVWRDGLFVEEPSRSIAFAALDWWRNSDYAAGLSLSDVDFQAFVAYDNLWTGLGHTFDHRFSEVQNLDDVLETVLKAGRAFPAPVGDKLTITRDQPRGLSRMLFTENDIVRDSLEIDYALSDEAWADGMVGEYVDQTTWRLAEVSSAPDGVQLLKPARIQLEGVVDRKQATGMVRFMAAESQYRRITVQWIARMEGRLLKRGDLVKITAEEPETWGQSAEIVAVAPNGITLTLDPAPIWSATGNHYVEIRRRDGRPWGPALVTRGGNDATAIVATNGDTAGLADALARSDTQERPWLAFSPGQPRTFPVLVTEGDPDQDGEHIHLTGVIDAPEVYATTENGVPPLLQIADLFSGAMPAIIGLSARIAQRQLTLVLTAGWQPARNAVSYVADVSYDTGQTWARAYEGDRTTFEAVVGGSDQMRVRVAGVAPSGARGAFYVVAVDCPDLILSNDAVGQIQIEYVDLGTAVQAQIDRLDGIQKKAEDAAAAAGKALTDALARLDLLRKSLARDPAVRQGLIDPIIADVRQDIDILTQAATRNAQDVSALRDALTTAGLETIPAQGRVRFYAIEALQTSVGSTISNFSVTVDALSKKIELYGSVQTGDLSGLITSITTVQTTLDALQGTIRNYVSAAQFNAVADRVSSAETKLDAQAAAITSKASQTTVDAQGVRLGTAELRISASEGRIFQAVQATAGSQFDLALLPQTLSGFFDFIQRQQGALYQQFATATTNIAANIDDAGRSTASVKTDLLVFKGDASAQFVDLVTAVADTNSALVTRTTALQADIGAAQASIVSEATVRAGADGAISTRVDGLTATVGQNSAGITSLAQAQADDRSATASQFSGVTARFAASEANVYNLSVSTASADAALGQRIDVVNGRVGSVEGAVATEASVRISQDNAIVGYLNSVNAKTDAANAGVANEASARASGDAASASNINDLYARSNIGTAFGRFGMTASSGPAGAAVRLTAQISTDSYGQQRNAGFFLDLLQDGTSRFVVDANVFAITANGGITYPFLFDGSTLTIPNLRVTNSAIIPGAVSQSGYGSAGGVYVDFQVNCRGNSRVSITAMFDGAPTGPGFSNLNPGKLQILRDGGLIRETPISFYVAGSNDSRAAFSLNTTTFVVDVPGPGVHTYRISNSGNQGPVSFKWEELAV